MTAGLVFMAQLHWHHLLEFGEKVMSGELVTAAVLSFSLILVGLSMGFVLLKIQGGEE